jgi:hypothetical protein
LILTPSIMPETNLSSITYFISNMSQENTSLHT